MNRYGIFIVLLLLNCGTMHFFRQQKTVADGDSQPRAMDIYLLIGQSNMAGRAAIEPPDRDTLAGVFLFTGVKGREWEPAANPLNKYSSIRKKLSMQKLGPGYTFAKMMAASSSGRSIGLVVNARGGTSISLWQPGTHYYNEAVRRTKAALHYGYLKGILWHQGESDARRYEAYTRQLIALINSLRAEFGQPDLPVVVGQLSEDKPVRTNLNRVISQLPRQIRRVGVVSAANLHTIDSTHFDSAGQRVLGERYARAMLTLIGRDSGF